METRATSLCAQTARHTHDTIRRENRVDARTTARRADARARDRARRTATARRRARDATRGDSTERGDASTDDRARDSKSRDSNDARAIRDGRDVGARDGDVGDGGDGDARRGRRRRQRSIELLFAIVTADGRERPLRVYPRCTSNMHAERDFTHLSALHSVVTDFCEVGGPLD